LNSIDFPTLGLPTIAMIGFMKLFSGNRIIIKQL
jgi:hypothetical protein